MEQSTSRLIFILLAFLSIQFNLANDSFLCKSMVYNLIQSDDVLYNRFESKYQELIKENKLYKALELCQKIEIELKKDTFLADLYLKKATTYDKLNDKKNTIIFVEKSIEAFQKNSDFSRISQISNILIQINKPEKVISFANAAIKYYELKRNNTKLVTAYRSLGDLHNALGNEDAALENYKIAYNFANKDSDYLQMSSINNNIVSIEIGNKDYNSALKKLLESKNLLVKTNATKETKFTIDNNIASLYIALKQFTRARTLLDSIKQFVEPNKFSRLSIANLITESEYYNGLKKYDDAINYLKKALQLSESSNNIFLLSEINSRLSENYENQKKYALSLNHFKQYKILNDSLKNISVQKNTLELQTKYDVLTYKNDIKFQENKIELLELRSKQTKYSIIILSIFLLLLIILAYRQYKTLIIKKKNALYLSEINKLKEEKLMQNVEFKKNQLTDFAIQIQEQNNFLIDLKRNLKSASKETTLADANKFLKNLSLTINKTIKINNEKVQLNTDIKESSEDFLLKLRELYPQLKPKEIKISTLIRLNYNTKQIAEQIGIAEHSVHNYRYSIRKKLKLNKEVQLDDFIKAI